MRIHSIYGRGKLCSSAPAITRALYHRYPIICNIALARSLRNNSMSNLHHDRIFEVKLTLQAAGPIRPRTKYKHRRILRAEGRITLPFVPYPGLYLTMEKPKKRGDPLTLYLRIRTVEWVLPAQHFGCVVDEMIESNLFSELLEVRGSPRIEPHFIELEKTLNVFGFDVITDASAMLALDKHPDGSWIKPPDTRLVGRYE